MSGKHPSEECGSDVEFAMLEDLDVLDEVEGDSNHDQRRHDQRNPNSVCEADKVTGRGTHVVVKGIPPDTDMEMLRRLFPNASDIGLPKSESGDNLGYAMLEFPSAEEARAIAKEQNLKIGDNTLQLFIKAHNKDDVYMTDSTKTRGARSTFSGRGTRRARGNQNFRTTYGRGFQRGRGQKFRYHHRFQNDAQFERGRVFHGRRNFRGRGQNNSGSFRHRADDDDLYDPREEEERFTKRFDSMERSGREDLEDLEAYEYQDSHFEEDQRYRDIDWEDRPHDRFPDNRDFDGASRGSREEERRSLYSDHGRRLRNWRDEGGNRVFKRGEYYERKTDRNYSIEGHHYERKDIHEMDRERNFDSERYERSNAEIDYLSEREDADERYEAYIKDKHDRDRDFQGNREREKSDSGRRRARRPDKFDQRERASEYASDPHDQYHSPSEGDRSRRDEYGPAESNYHVQKKDLRRRRHAEDLDTRLSEEHAFHQRECESPYEEREEFSHHKRRGSYEGIESLPEGDDQQQLDQIALHPHYQRFPEDMWMSGVNPKRKRQDSSADPPEVREDISERSRGSHRSRKHARIEGREAILPQNYSPQQLSNRSVSPDNRERIVQSDLSPGILQPGAAASEQPEEGVLVTRTLDGDLIITRPAAPQIQPEPHHWPVSATGTAVIASSSRGEAQRAPSVSEISNVDGGMLLTRTLKGDLVLTTELSPQKNIIPLTGDIVQKGPGTIATNMQVRQELLQSDNILPAPSAATGVLVTRTLTGDIVISNAEDNLTPAAIPLQLGTVGGNMIVQRSFPGLAVEKQLHTQSLLSTHILEAPTAGTIPSSPKRNLSSGDGKNVERSLRKREKGRTESARSRSPSWDSQGSHGRAEAFHVVDAKGHHPKKSKGVEYHEVRGQSSTRYAETEKDTKYKHRRHDSDSLGGYAVRSGQSSEVAMRSCPVGRRGLKETVPNISSPGSREGRDGQKFNYNRRKRNREEYDRRYSVRNRRNNVVLDNPDTSPISSENMHSPVSEERLEDFYETIDSDDPDGLRDAGRSVQSVSRKLRAGQKQFSSENQDLRITVKSDPYKQRNLKESFENIESDDSNSLRDRKQRHSAFTDDFNPPRGKRMYSKERTQTLERLKSENTSVHARQEKHGRNPHGYSQPSSDKKIRNPPALNMPRRSPPDKRERRFYSSDRYQRRNESPSEKQAVLRTSGLLPAPDTVKPEMTKYTDESGGGSHGYVTRKPDERRYHTGDNGGKGNTVSSYQYSNQHVEKLSKQSGYFKNRNDASKDSYSFSQQYQNKSQQSGKALQGSSSYNFANNYSAENTDLPYRSGQKNDNIRYQSRQTNASVMNSGQTYGSGQTNDDFTSNPRQKNTTISYKSGQTDVAKRSAVETTQNPLWKNAKKISQEKEDIKKLSKQPYSTEQRPGESESVADVRKLLINQLQLLQQGVETDPAAIADIADQLKKLGDKTKSSQNMGSSFSTSVQRSSDNRAQVHGSSANQFHGHSGNTVYATVNTMQTVATVPSCQQMQGSSPVSSLQHVNNPTYMTPQITQSSAQSGWPAMCSARVQLSARASFSTGMSAPVAPGTPQYWQQYSTNTNTALGMPPSQQAVSNQGLSTSGQHRPSPSAQPIPGVSRAYVDVQPTYPTHQFTDVLGVSPPEEKSANTSSVYQTPASQPNIWTNLLNTLWKT